MTFPKLINNDPKKNLFDYDGGDLWVRDSVSYWDDQDYCWDNEILNFIHNTKSISEFEWKINYTIPYESQINDLKDNEVYKVREDNEFFTEVIKYSKNNLYLVDDILLYDPKFIVEFVNKLNGIKNIYFGMNLMQPSDIFMDLDDDWIKYGLKNSNWETSAFMPENSEDLEDIKYIKNNIDQNINLDFSVSDGGLKILKDNGIL